MGNLLKSLFYFFEPAKWKGMFSLSVKQLRNNKISFIGVWITIFLVVLTSTICANLITSSILHPVYDENHKNVQLAMFSTFITYIAIMSGVILLSGISFSITRRWSMFANLRILGMQQTDLRRMICAEAILMSLSACVVGIPIGGALSQSTIDLFVSFNLTPKTFKFEFNILPYIVVIFGMIAILLIICFFASKKLRDISITEKTNPYKLGDPSKIAIKVFFGIALIFAPIITLLVYDFGNVRNKGDESLAGVINVALIGPCVGVSLIGKYITYAFGHVFSKLFHFAPRISHTFSSLKKNSVKLNPIFISIIITTLLTMFVFTANSLIREYMESIGRPGSKDDTKSEAATMILITIILIFTIINIINYILLFVYDKEQSIKLRLKLGESRSGVYKSLILETFVVTFFSLIIGLLYPLLFTFEFSHSLMSRTVIIYNPTVFWTIISGLIVITIISSSIGYGLSINKKEVKIRYLENRNK